MLNKTKRYFQKSKRGVVAVASASLLASGIASAHIPAASTAGIITAADVIVFAMVAVVVVAGIVILRKWI